MKIGSLLFIFIIFIVVGLSWGVISSWPDGKLHVIFCSVGQGDAILIKFPNRADMLIDGGPNNQVLTCLGNHLPFYDRTIDVIVLTHPEKDHYQGLLTVLKRYNVKYFVSIDQNYIEQIPDIKAILDSTITIKRTLWSGSEIKFDQAFINVLWPSADDFYNWNSSVKSIAETADTANVFSMYLHLQYGQFDALFTGDGDESTQVLLKQLGRFESLPEQIELFKVPHHGSKTSMAEFLLPRIQPKLSVISVGKNVYGHPNQNVQQQLQKWGKVLRTDEMGDIEVISDSKSWWVKK